VDTAMILPQEDPPRRWRYWTTGRHRYPHRRRYVRIVA